MGSHRGECVRERCNECARGGVSERSTTSLSRTTRGYHDPARVHSELKKAGFSSVVIETRADQSRASSPRHPAVAYCQGTPLRNEIEARDADKLDRATNYAAPKIANRHGSAEVAAKIQALVIVAVA